MSIKIYCDSCEGFGFFYLSEVIEKVRVPDKETPCPACDGKGFKEYKGSLSDLECTEIKKEITKYFKWSIDYLESSVRVWIHRKDTSEFLYTKDENTELEALRQAKNWMDGRGAE